MKLNGVELTRDNQQVSDFEDPRLLGRVAGVAAVGVASVGVTAVGGTLVNIGAVT